MNGIFGALRLPASVVFGSGQRAAIRIQLSPRAISTRTACSVPISSC